jgi:sugar/nucleoside kinase (ribokinase family)
MHRVIVIGGVNHDRIWQLKAPLTPGKRVQYSQRVTRIGGGGFYTGQQLLDLGAEVTLISRLKRDEQGLSALKTLEEIGFDTQQIEMLPGETIPLEILLEPDGERTIITFSDAPNPPFCLKGPVTGAAAYINALILDDELVARLNHIPLVISQLPLREATARPADWVISSRTDAGSDVGAAWQAARAIAGPRLKTLVITDGTRPTILFDGETAVEVSAPPPVKVVSTIGAGDRFGGAFAFYLLEGMTPAAAVEQAGREVAEWLQSAAVDDPVTERDKTSRAQQEHVL